MIYPFLCDACGYEVEAVRTSDHASDEEICPHCSIAMRRVYTPPQIAPIQIMSFYSPAHGERIRGKSHLKDLNKKYNDTTGNEIMEVGSDKSLISRKKKRQSYDLPREVMAKIEEA